MIKLAEGVQRRATKALLSSFSWPASKLSIRASRETESSTRTETCPSLAARFAHKWTACWQAVVKQYNERPERIDLLYLVYSREVRNLATFYKLPSVVTYSKLRSFSSKVK